MICTPAIWVLLLLGSLGWLLAIVFAAAGGRIVFWLVQAEDLLDEAVLDEAALECYERRTPRVLGRAGRR